MQREAALRKTLPDHTRPSDFTHFWSDTLALLNAVPLSIVRKSTRELGEGLVLEEYDFTSLGACPIRAYWIRHQSAADRELVVTTHGYNSQCNPTLDKKARFALSGANVMAFDVRGFGASRSAVAVSPAGYITTGIESPQTSLLRGAVCDYLCAHAVAKELLGKAPRRTAFHGYSFAGGLATMAQAISQAADLLAVGVPTFGWTQGRRELVQRGSGAEVNSFLARYPEQEQAALSTLAYFDTMNHAPRVTCDALVGVGLEDDVVPAATVFAIINHMGRRPEVLEFPCSHTKRPEEALWRGFDDAWLKRLHGGRKVF